MTNTQTQAQTKTQTQTQTKHKYVALEKVCIDLEPLEVREAKEKDHPHTYQVDTYVVDVNEIVEVIIFPNEEGSLLLLNEGKIEVKGKGRAVKTLAEDVNKWFKPVPSPSD